MILTYFDLIIQLIEDDIKIMNEEIINIYKSYSTSIIDINKRYV